jgi:hypothetical protein
MLICRTGCVWKHPFIYIASGAGVGPGSGFAGVCASALIIAAVRRCRYDTQPLSPSIRTANDYSNQIHSYKQFHHKLELVTQQIPPPPPRRNSPCWASAPSLSRLHNHTHIYTYTFGRTPLNERSARPRNLYLTTYNTHNRHTCPQRDSNPQSQQANGRRPTS